MKQGCPAYIEYLADILTVGGLEKRIALVDELMKEDKITFLQEYKIIFAKGAFFMPDGRVTDGLSLHGKIYDKLKFCAVNNIPPEDHQHSGSAETGSTSAGFSTRAGLDSSSILNDVDFHRRKLRGLRYVAARSIGFARCVHFAMYS